MVHWKLNMNVFKADAQKVYDEITLIGDSATPEQIVEKAKDESTELHKCFEWDDTKAAEGYRLMQAQKIVRLLVVDANEISPKAPKEPIRLFVNVDTRSRKYEPMHIVVKEADKYARLLEQAKRELAAFVNKYRVLSEFEPVFEALKEIL